MYYPLMVPQNVAMKVDRPRKEQYQPTFLDADEMQELFKVVKGTRLELPVLVAAFYGLRRGEVLGTQVGRYRLPERHSDDQEDGYGSKA